MLRVGANRVVNPYHLGGARLAHLLVKPAVVDFLDLSLSPAGDELEIEQVRLAGSGPLVVLGPHERLARFESEVCV